MKDHEIAAHVETARETAAMLGGVVCRVSAALVHGYDVLTVPDLPQITVPRHRRRERFDRDVALVRRMDLPHADVVDAVTTPDRTFIDCLRWLPPQEGLALVDGRLRQGMTPTRISRLAIAARGPGSVKVRRVCGAMDRRAANVFESTLRAICLSVRDLHVQPQVPIGGAAFLGTPDLVDVVHGIVIEADSFTWHGQRRALVADARRYNGFAAHGWLVLRFSWEEVMPRPDEVRRTLERAVALRRAGAA